MRYVLRKRSARPLSVFGITQLLQLLLHGIPSFNDLVGAFPSSNVPHGNARPFSSPSFLSLPLGSRVNNSGPLPLEACLQAAACANTPLKAQRALYTLAKCIEQDKRDRKRYSPQEREGIVQAGSMLVTRLLGEETAAAAAPVQQFIAKELSLTAWSLSKIVDVDSRVRSSQMRQLMDAMAARAVEGGTMDQPADRACMQWSMLIYGISASGILCKDSQAVQHLFDVAARRLPEMLHSKQPCEAQNVSNPLWAFATTEHTGSLQHLVAEIAENLGVMQGAEPQVCSYASRPFVQHFNLKKTLHF
jgi:hypothetical protein